MRPVITATLEGDSMTLNDGDGVVVNAILELKPGDWDASTGEVVDGVLVMTPAMRTRRCCGRDLELVAEAVRGSLTWGLWRCRRCERWYSIGPRLPAGWCTPLARACIELYCDYRAAVAAAYET
jgi:hypothetical protein